VLTRRRLSVVVCAVLCVTAPHGLPVTSAAAPMVRWIADGAKSEAAVDGGASSRLGADESGLRRNPRYRH
jgi:hypothetical protein